MNLKTSKREAYPIVDEAAVKYYLSHGNERRRTLAFS